MLFVIALSSLDAYAQQKTRFSAAGTQRGQSYSRQIGDFTYEQDESGQVTGYSRDVGGRAMDFDKQGRDRGYQETRGDVTYKYTSGGRQKPGYEVQVGDGVNPGSGQFPTQDTAPTGYWGFSHSPGEEQEAPAQGDEPIANYKGQGDPDKPDGYIRKVGDRIIQFDSEGREIGREEKIGAEAVIEGPEGELRREVDPSKPNFAEHHRSNTWGFSGDEKFDVGE